MAPKRLLVVVGAVTLVAAFAESELATPPPAESAPFGLYQGVTDDDRDLGRNLLTGFGRIGFVDANGNGRADHLMPDEPFYADLDDDHAVTLGDLRLTRFLNYEAGSAANFTNRDFGLRLSTPLGWFARDASGAVYLDADAQRLLSPGDVRLDGERAGTKVALGDPGVGTPLQPLQENVPTPLRLGWIETDGDNRLDPNEVAFYDLDGDKEVSTGDLRLVRGSPIVDNDPTRDQFDALAQDQASGDQALSTRVDAVDERLDAWVVGLMVLGLVNLGGLVGLAWYLHKRLEPPVRQAGGRESHAPPSQAPGAGSP